MPSRGRTVNFGLLNLLLYLVFISSSQASYFECPTSSTNPVIIHGKRFFDSITGEYFPIKGIAYYPRPNNGPLSVANSVDFFTDECRDLWEPDIQNFGQLGVNTIPIYAVDPSRNHDSFMCALQEAGIYVVIELLADCENCGIGPNQAPSCYPSPLKTRGQWIINEFSRYANTLLFSAGNEVTLYSTDRQIELNAPCQKKFIRDMRSYIRSCSKVHSSILPRPVPIGVVNWDFLRVLQTKYYTCTTDPEDDLENAEWFGLNAYLHCDPKAESIDELGGWITMKNDFEALNLPVPIVIAEYGCRERFPTIEEFEAQRTWLQVDALYNDEYQDVFAGGVVFEYSAEKRVVDTSDQKKSWPYFEFMKLQYGVGYYSPVNCDQMTIPCEYIQYPEFDLLAEKIGAINVSYVPSLGQSTPTGKFPECPSELAPLHNFTWPTEEEPDLPCYTVRKDIPSNQPNNSIEPTALPSTEPSPAPIFEPSSKPSSIPSATTVQDVAHTLYFNNSSHLSASPSSKPSSVPSAKAVETSTHKLYVEPSSHPSASPSKLPSLIINSPQPTTRPSITTNEPSSKPNAPLTSSPTLRPSLKAPVAPTPTPWASPSLYPTPTSAAPTRLLVPASKLTILTNVESQSPEPTTSESSSCLSLFLSTRTFALLIFLI